MRISSVLTTATVGVSLLVLTACSGGDEVDTEPTNTPAPVEEPADTPEPVDEPTTEPADEEVDEPAPAGDYTAPGSELSTSEDLYVPLEESWWDAEIEGSDSREIGATYTFDGIREGQASDLSSAFGEDDIATLEQYGIWFVDYTISLDGGALSEPAHGITEATKLDAIDAAGSPNAVNAIFFDGGPEICKNASLTDLAKEGTTTACQLVATTKGESIKRLEFHGFTLGGKESPYDGNPAVWVIE